VATDPHYTNAYTALGALYWQEKKTEQAGEFFGKAAELAPLRSAKRLQYAKFKLQGGDTALARKIVESILEKAPDYLPAEMLLAEIYEQEGKYDDGAAAVDAVIAREASYPDALLLSARFKLAKKEPAKAVTILENARSFFPRSPLIEFQLSQAYLETGAIEKAEAALNLAISWAPEYVEAAMSCSWQAPTSAREG
jgi:Tfp pilus assembly protein PilF